MRYQRARICASGALLLAVCLFAARCLFPSLSEAVSQALLVMGAIAVLCWFLTALLWCRCPHCGRRIIQKILLLRECPACGKPLWEDSYDFDLP